MLIIPCQSDGLSHPAAYGGPSPLYLLLLGFLPSLAYCLCWMLSQSNFKVEGLVSIIAFGVQVLFYSV